MKNNVKKHFLETKRKIKETILKSKAKIAMMTVMFNFIVVKNAMAAPNVGESIKEWGLAQLLPVCLVFVAVLLIGMLIKKNYVKAVMVLCVGGAVAAIIAKPTVISTVGGYMLEIIGLA